MSTPKVLVIDDEQIVLDSVRKVLGDTCTVTTTLSSRQGLEWAVRGTYDLVLTDIRMPEIDGMRVLRDAKRARPALPVVIITGFATVQSAVEAMKLGAAHYIEKPFTPDELLAVVRGALDPARQPPPEVQEIIHTDAVLQVLERAGRDVAFSTRLFEGGADALAEYGLTGPEKLAILTADVAWIEKHVGRLTPVQRRWCDQRLGAEF